MSIRPSSELPPTLGSAAVLVIDMHRGSIDPPGTVYVPEGRRAVAGVARTVAAARDAGVPVVWVVHQTEPDGSDARSPFWLESRSVGALYPNVREQVVGSRWTELADGLEAREGDYVFPKKRYGAFSGNGLQLLLRNLAVDTLVLTGVETEICVLATAFHAFNEDYRVVVVSDAVEGLDAELADAALRIIAREVGWVLPSDEVAPLLAAPAAVEA